MSLWPKKPRPQATTAPEFPGVAVVFGATELVMPPLNFAALKQLLPRIEGMGALTLDRATIALVTDCAHAALLRNYPQLKRAQVEQWVDVGNFAEVFSACMDVGGLKRQEQAPGKARPGSIGTASTSG